MTKNEHLIKYSNIKEIGQNNTSMYCIMLYIYTHVSSVLFKDNISTIIKRCANNITKLLNTSFFRRYITYEIKI